MRALEDIARIVRAMDSALRAAASVFQLNQRLVLSCVEGMDDATVQTRLTDNTNHVAFLFAHLVGARRYLLGLLGVPVEDPFPELAKAKSLDDVDRFPSLEAMRSAWDEMGERLSAALESLDEAQLDERSPQDFPVDDKSFLGGVAFVAQHESYHVGQLAMLRKALGLGAMSYD